MYSKGFVTIRIPRKPRTILQSLLKMQCVSISVRTDTPAALPDRLRAGNMLVDQLTE